MVVGRAARLARSARSYTSATKATASPLAAVAHSSSPPAAPSSPPAGASLQWCGAGLSLQQAFDAHSFAQLGHHGEVPAGDADEDDELDLQVAAILRQHLEDAFSRGSTAAPGMCGPPAAALAVAAEAEALQPAVAPPPPAAAASLRASTKAVEARLAKPAPAAVPLTLEAALQPSTQARQVAAQRASLLVCCGLGCCWCWVCSPPPLMRSPACWPAVQLWLPLLLTIPPLLPPLAAGWLWRLRRHTRLPGPTWRGRSWRGWSGPRCWASPAWRWCRCAAGC